jgi:hypothetical protein
MDKRVNWSERTLGGVQSGAKESHMDTTTLLIIIIIILVLGGGWYGRGRWF